MLDRLLKISSLASALLIFCGVLKLHLYYSHFNIRIIEFLSFSEIITSFLDDINVILIFCFAMILQTVPTLNYLHRKSKSTDSLSVFFEKMMIQAFPKRKKMILSFLGILILTLILIWAGVVQWSYFVIYFIIFCIIQALTFLLLTKGENDKIDLPDLSTWLIMIVAIVSALFLLTQYDIQKTLSNEYQAVITTSDTIIDCNPKTQTIYIGKTDNYLFILNKDHSTTVIPVADVRKLVFKR